MVLAPRRVSHLTQVRSRNPLRDNKYPFRHNAYYAEIDATREVSKHGGVGVVVLREGVCRVGEGVYLKIPRVKLRAKSLNAKDAMVTMPQKNVICRICAGQRLFKGALANS
jgi:hypothetical protein